MNDKDKLAPKDDDIRVYVGIAVFTLFLIALGLTLGNR